MRLHCAIIVAEDFCVQVETLNHCLKEKYVYCCVFLILQRVTFVNNLNYIKNTYNTASTLKVIEKYALKNVIFVAKTEYI